MQSDAVTIIMKIIIAAALLLAGCSPAQAQQTRVCDRVSWFQHDLATGPVELVPGVAAKRIYPCGFILTQKGTTLDFQMFGASPGSACTVRGVEFTPVLSLPPDLALVNRLANVGPAAIIGNSLCIQTFGNGKLSGAIYWAQF